jgi:Na+-driven multidrug efflux pump
MPGYGVEDASTTIIGQCIGAGRKKTAVSFGKIVILFGMILMTVTGALMFIFAPWMIGIMTRDKAICDLSVQVLRIEAFAEPLFAASIVAAGVLRGAGDTFVPSIMNFASLWLVRLPLSAFLAPRFGLRGVWIAMATELCVRGIIFLVRFAGGKWVDKGIVLANKE